MIKTNFSRMCSAVFCLLFASTSLAATSQDNTPYSPPMVESIAHKQKMLSHLPRQITPYLVMSDITSQGRTLVIRYDITNMNSFKEGTDPDKDAENALHAIIPATQAHIMHLLCHHPDMIGLLSHGGTVRMDSYRGKSTPMFSSSFDEHSCVQP